MSEPNPNPTAPTMTTERLSDEQPINITDGIPSEIYIGIGRGHYDDMYDLARDVALSIREESAAELLRLRTALAAKEREDETPISEEWLRNVGFHQANNRHTGSPTFVAEHEEPWRRLLVQKLTLLEGEPWILDGDTGDRPSIRMRPAKRSEVIAAAALIGIPLRQAADELEALVGGSCHE